MHNSRHVILVTESEPTADDARATERRASESNRLLWSYFARVLAEREALVTTVAIYGRG